MAIHLKDIIWPDEVILQVVIGAIVFLALVILYRCRIIKVETRDNLRLLEATEDVSFLEGVLKRNDVDYEASFNNYKAHVLSRTKLSEGSGEQLFEHLKAIYDAGHQSSRLDADLLVRNTIGKIFSGIDTTRALISLFLVVGILGTLFGLAISFSALASSRPNLPTNTGNLALMATVLSQGIVAQITDRLKGAFAPSMWGVFFTIAYVSYFSLFVQDGCINKLTAKLTSNTVNKWLPVLYPTAFQKSENSIIKLNETVRNADRINIGANALMHNLTEANATIQALQLTAKSITECNAAFDRGANEFRAMREAVAAMSAQIQSHNNQFTSLVGTSMTRWGDELKRQGDELEKQLRNVSEKLENNSKQAADTYVQQANQINVQLKQMLNTYEKHNLAMQQSQKEGLLASIAQNKEIALQMGGVTKEASAKMGAMTDKARELKQELVAAVGQPLQELLQKELQTMSDTLGKGLADVSTQLDTKVGEPLRQQLANDLGDVSGKIEKTADRLTLLNSTMNKGLGTVSADLAGKVGEPLRQQLAIDLQEVSGKIEKAADRLTLLNSTVNKGLEGVSADLATKVGEPLRQQLASDLQGVGSNIEKAVKELERINNPLIQTSNKMNQMFNTFAEQFEYLLNKLGDKAGVGPVTQDKPLAGDGLGEKLDAILAELKQQEDRRQAAAVEGAQARSSLLHDYLPWVVALLLFISIVFQVVMVRKLDDLVTAQAAARSSAGRVSVQLEEGYDRLGGRQLAATQHLTGQKNR